jgi:hypothetical protein
MQESNNIKKLSNSLKDTLADSDLQNVTSDLAETFTDTLLNDGILKDIPILGTIIGLAKASISLNERLLIKKLIYFLSELKNIEPEKRQKLIDTIDSNEKHKINVGEKLLYIIDKCDDHIIAKYTAILFSSFLNEEISYSDFLRGSTIIQKLFLYDLESFIKIDSKELERKITKYSQGLSDFENNLINVGICSTETEPISVSDQDDYKMHEKYKVNGGDMHLYLTDIGKILKIYMHSR